MHIHCLPQPAPVKATRLPTPNLPWFQLAVSRNMPTHILYASFPEDLQLVQESQHLKTLIQRADMQLLQEATQETCDHLRCSPCTVHAPSIHDPSHTHSSYRKKPKKTQLMTLKFSQQFTFRAIHSNTELCHSWSSHPCLSMSVPPMVCSSV